MGSLGTVHNSSMICVPLMGESIEQMVRGMFRAKAECADVVEVRLDYIKDFKPRQDLKTLLKNKPLPVIIVYRPKWEGGLYEGEETLRLETLLLAKELGADYVDFELKASLDLMGKVKTTQQSNCKIIVSRSLSSVTPSDDLLSHVVAQMQSTGADIIRLVISACNITETATIFKLLSNVQVPLIAYSIGDRGLISQILCPKYGGILLYGSMEGDSVPGLPTLRSLKQAYKPEYINADTKVFGLISNPVSHSKGPILHNPTFRHMNFNGIYVPMLVDDLKEFFKVYNVPDFAGYSVGIPYKEAVIESCDEVDPLAQSIGAVNTIVKSRDGKLIGYNTDCEAAITAIEDALRERVYIFNEINLASPLSGIMFVLVGAGGAGRALAFGAKSRGAKIIIADIDFDRAESLARAVSGQAMRYEDIINFQPEKGAILANATPLGMHPLTDKRIPVAEVTLGDYQLVFDSVYTPRKTRLMKEAEAAGAIIVSGVEMFLRQAIGQFELFTGRKAPEEFMREIVLSKF